MQIVLRSCTVSVSVFLLLFLSVDAQAVRRSRRAGRAGGPWARRGIGV
jgi:hypothetical protein